MPPRQPLYTNPILDILRGGKQTQAPQRPVQFGVPTAQPSIPSPTATRTTTPAFTAQPAPIVPRMPVQQPGLQSMVPVNPLDILKMGKGEVIRQGATQSISPLRRIAQKLPANFEREVFDRLARPLNFLFPTEQDYLREATDELLAQNRNASTEQIVTRSKELMVKDGFVSLGKEQEIGSGAFSPLDTVGVAGAISRGGVALKRAVRLFGNKIKGANTPDDALRVANEINPNIANKNDSIVTDIVKAKTNADVQKAITRILEDVQKTSLTPPTEVLRKEVGESIVLENMARLKENPMRVPPDDFTRFDDLAKQMERRALTPDEIAEAKAIVERVDGKLPNPEVGAMDIKPVARAAETTQPTNQKLADFRAGKPSSEAGFANFFTPAKAPPTPAKTPTRIKFDADLAEIRKSLQNKDLTAQRIGELETRLSMMEEAVPDVSLIRRIAGKQLANGDTLSQVQATAQKIVSQSDFLKSISLTDAERILKSPKSFTARDLEGARTVRRAHLDELVTESGYGSLDEAGEAVAQFDRLKADMTDLKDNLREAKGERALSNKVRQVVTTATAKRREEVNFLAGKFGLLDSDIKKVSGGRDYRTMSEGSFNDFVRRMEQRGIERADTTQAKIELMDLMERRQFQKVENYRRAQELPPLSEMNADQFRQYAEALEQFQTNDVFLTQRQLEVVDRSSLAGVRTIREARERLLEHIRKMPGLENTKIEDLNVTPTPWDYVRYDTSLAEKNPFYKYLVTRTQEHMLVGEAEFLTVQNKALELASKAAKSRKRGVGDFVKQLFIPKHEEIIRYLEAPIDQKATFAKALTKEELDYANFASDYYGRAYDHLVMQKELQGSRYIDEYFNHIRRTFLETWSDDGFIQAIKESWQAQKDSLMVSNILDQNTGKILPKSKFFANTMYRSGEIVPTKNFTRAFLQYAKSFERKKMFDRMIPEMDIYVQSLTPTNLTPKGLEMDHRLKDFFYSYMNNKKGRTESISKLITQNNPIDIGLRMGNSLVSIIDLGFSLIAQSAATVGEFVATYQGLGKVSLAKGLKRRLWDTGIKRMTDPNAKKILADNEQFIGRNLWTELAEVDTPLTDKAMKTMFGGFSQATAEANKIFLLSNLTEAELKAGVISPQRLAQLRLDAGRWRDLGKDVKSIVGSTSVGQMITKYKGWAIPIARTNISNLSTLTKKLAKGDMKGVVTSRELQETYRLVELSAIVFLIGQYVMAQDEDETFVGKLKARAYMEANTLMSGIDPVTFVSAPRLLTFAEQLAKNLKSIVLLETYNTDSQWGNEGDLKGVRALQRQLTPATIRSMQKPASSTGDPELDAIRKEQSTSQKESQKLVDELVKEVQNMTPEQRRERLLQEEPDVINKVVDKLLEAQAKEQDPDQFRKDRAIKALNNENKAKYILTQVEKMPIEERREYIRGLLDRGVISANVVNRLAELASERDIIEQ